MYFNHQDRGLFCYVRMKGLEPPCLAALDPKSSASTNFATSAMNKFSDLLVIVKIIFSYLYLPENRTAKVNKYTP